MKHFRRTSLQPQAELLIYLVLIAPMHVIRERTMNDYRGFSFICIEGVLFKNVKISLFLYIQHNQSPLLLFLVVVANVMQLWKRRMFLFVVEIKQFQFEIQDYKKVNMLNVISNEVVFHATDVNKLV